MARTVQPISEAYLERVALHYLERYPGSVARVRRVLDKRVRASIEALGTDPEDGARALEAVIAKLGRLGLLDDERLAASRVRALRARGKSARAIRASLLRQGVDPAHIDRALRDDGAAGDGADPEIAAARALVRKRRMGRAEERQRDLARLARAGFSYDVARRALDDFAEG